MWQTRPTSEPATRLAANFGGRDQQQSTGQGHWRSMIDEADDRVKDDDRGRLRPIEPPVESMTMPRQVADEVNDRANSEAGGGSWLTRPNDRVNDEAVVDCRRRGQWQSQNRQDKTVDGFRSARLAEEPTARPKADLG